MTGPEELPRLALAGRTLDVLLGVLILDAGRDETVSHYVARRSRVDGAGWARVADAYLSLTIESDHTGRVLRGEPTSRRGIISATVQIGAVILAACYGLGKGVDAVVGLIGGIF